MDKEFVILWFDGHLLVDTGAGDDGLRGCPLPDREDPVKIIVDFVSTLDEKPSSVRLLYQPVDIEALEIKTSNVPRGKLRETLGGKYPDVLSETVPWCVSRMQKSEATYATLLWIDKQQRLPRLRKAFAEINIRLVGAWPLVSALEEVEPTNTPGKSAVAVVLTDAAAFVYNVTAAGNRWAKFSIGHNFRGALKNLIDAAVAKRAGEQRPPVLIVDAGELQWDFEETTLRGTVPSRLALTQLTAVALKLKTTSLSNYLPKERVIRVDRAIWAAAALFALIFLISGGRYYAEYRNLSVAGKKQTDESVRLNRENEHFAANKKIIDVATEWETETRVAEQGRLEILKAVMNERPPELTIHSLVINDKEFTITGTEHEQLGEKEAPYNKFLKALSDAGDKDKVWSITTKDSVLAVENFTITGTFNQ